MKFLAHITVMPKREILDPQGKAVTAGISNLGLAGINNVRVGKHVTLEIEADTEADANNTVMLACQKLLANLIMEDYSFHLSRTDQ